MSVPSPHPTKIKIYEPDPVQKRRFDDTIAEVERMQNDIYMNRSPRVVIEDDQAHMYPEVP